MMGWILFVSAAFAFYWYIYRNWEHVPKLIFKGILAGISIIFTVCLVIGVFTLIRDMYETRKDNSPEGRMDTVVSVMNRGDYCSVAFWLSVDEDYEPEFDYIWERLRMYASYNRYLVYTAAEENEALSEEYEGMAERYKVQFAELCQNPEFTENKEFGEYYLEQMGMTCVSP